VEDPPQAGPGETRRIAVLPPVEARKIAAGEVIDRPSALIREFLDNAIDAGGSHIGVFIEDGGIRRAEVTDDGEGMDRENLALCWLTHATSKIRSLEDLSKSLTLGFRGEALAAAAAVSHLAILSSADDREAWKLEVGPGEEAPLIEGARRTRGTSVSTRGLFDTLPARKRFLKRGGSEALLCRQVFTDKALAFPEIDFRFTQDGNLKTWLPPAGSLKERFARVFLSPAEAEFLHEISAPGQGFQVRILIGGPELYRNDRRQQYVFANSRRIQDYGLLQALEYGAQGWFPNGTHPVGAIYVEIDPALADFNIHPAKREARFADPGAIHHAVSAALRDFLRSGSRLTALRREGQVAAQNVPQKAVPDTVENGGGSLFPRNGKAWGGGAFYGKPPGAGGVLAMEAMLDRPPSFAPLPGRSGPPEGGEALAGHDAAAGTVALAEAPAVATTVAEESPPYGELRFIGRLFSLFLLVERGDKLLIIDQHAAHERILYDRFLSRPIAKQELLVPLPFSTESPEEDRFLTAKREELERLGIRIEAEEDGVWHITALPENWRLSDRETLKAVRELREAGENMAERWAATLSCHSAVRDGDYLDDRTALALAEAALALPIPRCPHGRPIWFELSRENIYRAVRRI
jgi:DNA mismatch repair protein MutL